MMQMIEAGGVPILADGVRSADEDNPRGYYELEAVKGIARDASFLAEAPGRAVKIVTPLLTSLPPEFAYRVILVERDLGEVMASQRAMMTRRGTGDGADDGAMRRAFESALVRARAWLDAAEEVETRLAKLDADLKFLLEDAGVSEPGQAHLAAAAGAQVVPATP